jgi:pantetheine-phosphate adenylyltransferase
MLLLYPGSFDPLHLGHLDLVKRGAALCERLVVGVGANPDKKAFLTVERRVALLRAETAAFGNVSVESYEGATLLFARKIGATALLRGVRNTADFELEEAMAAVHRTHALETLFLMTSGACSHISATAVKLALSAGLPLNGLVPPSVAQALERR